LRRLVVLAALATAPALAVSPEAREYVEVSKKLEPVHCQKRKLTREIALAEVERDAARVKTLRAQFDKLGRDPQTVALEKRLRALEPRIIGSDGKVRHAGDLDVVDRQRREAFYRCE